MDPRCTQHSDKWDQCESSLRSFREKFSEQTHDQMIAFVRNLIKWGSKQITHLSILGIEGQERDAYYDLFLNLFFLISFNLDTQENYLLSVPQVRPPEIYFYFLSFIPSLSKLTSQIEIWILHQFPPQISVQPKVSPAGSMARALLSL